ncbi:hypothetical protein LWE61_08975 [Sphingobium sufflavum]|uniref:hypothetical protein n=1 Tax=Sphingobium sufflavum TaxID=1129547 RepID=UPI001F3018E3|nr:hypothetical protein [Sphingobium sufflavum]MCE7796692.1 hypothetical protein [Sphingobium sufflavum]
MSGLLNVGAGADAGAGAGSGADAGAGAEAGSAAASHASHLSHAADPVPSHPASPTAMAGDPASSHPASSPAMPGDPPPPPSAAPHPAPAELVREAARALAEAVLPDAQLQPRSVDDVLALPTFLTALHAAEKRTNTPIDRLSLPVQQALVQRRLRQLVAISRVNPLWRDRIAGAVGTDPVADFDAFQSLPLTDKELSRIYYAEDRPGLVVPVERGGYQVATSGGTASGKPSEIVYPLDELWDTYAWAGAFLGRHVVAPHMPGDGPHWVATTLADHMMWSSSTMVGGVLQRIPGINFIGAGAIDRHVFGRILAYPGAKAIMGTSRSIADLVSHANHLSPEERASFRVALYGSGEIQPRVRADLKAAYPNLSILSFFAAMQAETIGLQLEVDSPVLTAVPGLHLVEVVDEQGRWVDVGEEGELVVTRLFGHGAPVLRYRLGDRVVRREDRQTAALNAVQFEYVGRSSDRFAIGPLGFFATDALGGIAVNLRRRGLLDIEGEAEDVQIRLDHAARTFRLIVVTPNAESLAGQAASVAASRALVTGLVRSLGARCDAAGALNALMNGGYRFTLSLLTPGAPGLHLTEVGKVPLLVETR